MAGGGHQAECRKQYARKYLGLGMGYGALRCVTCLVKNPTHTGNKKTVGRSVEGAKKFLKTIGIGRPLNHNVEVLMALMFSTIKFFDLKLKNNTRKPTLFSLRPIPSPAFLLCSYRIRMPTYTTTI